MKNIIAAITLLSWCISSAAETDQLSQALTEAEQNIMTLKAEQLIDSWNGNNLNQASDILSRVLQANPKNKEAHFERARFLIQSGHINYRNFQPGTLSNAAKELEYAIKQDPSWGKAYVLLGHVQYLGGNPTYAIELFKKAEALNTDYKWLYINWGNALVDINDFSGAEIKLTKAKARNDLTVNELSGLNEALINVYSRQGKIDNADQVYKDNINLNPNPAWAHGNYADFLLLSKGLPDASIEEANKALKIMDYGMGHIILGRAQYAKWAQLANIDPTTADKYYVNAQKNAPNLAWVLPLIGMSVDKGPVLENTVLALIKKGVSIDITDNNGDTAFILASGIGNVKAMNWLAQHGANINVHSERPSALMYAISKNNLLVVRALMSLKVDVNLVDTKGLTPLMIAAYKGNKEIIDLLLTSGADPSLKSKINFTAADYAMNAGRDDLANYIRNQEYKVTP